MRTSRILLSFFCLVLFCLDSFAQNAAEADETYLFDIKENVELLMDEYLPTKGSQTSIDGKRKPTVIFMFGGGFVGGRRDQNGYRQWYQMLCDRGYHVFAIDYRLGLKGVSEKGTKMAEATLNAINLGVEDLFSATNYILQNAEMLDVDPDNIVIGGASAGAIISLQAEWEISNHGTLASVLPEGFNYAGVMSFAGAVLSDHGSVSYSTRPCPQFLAHGTADKIVNYKQMKVLKWNFCGSSILVGKLKRKGAVYQIFRFEGYGHEIAGSMKYLIDEQTAFLENVIVKKEKKTIDKLVKDSAIPKGSSLTSRKQIYGN